MRSNCIRIARCGTAQSRSRWYSDVIASTARQRWYSIHAEHAAPRLKKLDPTRLSISRTLTPKDLLPPEELIWGKTFTGKDQSFRKMHSLKLIVSDHMLSVEWTATEGWFEPQIIPYQKIALEPSSTVFHYAFECFEGMKAYKDAQGNIRLFRPDKNMQRLNRSSTRIALPSFNGDALTQLIAQLAFVDDRFIPEKRGYSLYIRPTIIGTQNTLGVGAPGSALLFVIASPVGPYYPTGFKAISLEATDYAVRAWPGGVGNMKLGANYAPCVLPQKQAASRGYQQNLWLFGEEEYVTEVGTMNLFIAIKHSDGTRELLTPPLDGTILEGVTRDSILCLAKERMEPQGWLISERKMSIAEIAKASNDGRLLEVFGSGTAAIVSPVRTISWKGREVSCGLEDHSEAGPIALQMKEWIEAIQYGEEHNPWRSASTLSCV